MKKIKIKIERLREKLSFFEELNAENGGYNFAIAKIEEEIKELIKERGNK